jgi:hypothetical protein
MTSVAIFAEAMLGYVLREEEEAGRRIQPRVRYLTRRNANHSGLGVFELSNEIG